MGNNTLPAGTVLKSQSAQYELKQIRSASAGGVRYEASAMSTAGPVPTLIRVIVKQYVVGPGGPGEMLAAATQLRNVAAGSNNIISLSDVFESGGNVFGITAMMEGETLRDYVAARGRLTESQTLAVMRPVVDAVAAVHQSNLSHLNIKPENIVMTRAADGTEIPVLIDFALQGHSVAQGAAPDGFTAVEQYAGIKNYSPASDVYSLAATMLYCLSGTMLQPGAQISADQLTRMVPDITPHLKEVLLASLSLRVADRPANAVVLANMLNGVANMSQTPQPSAPFVPPTAPQAPQTPAATPVIPVVPVTPAGPPAPPVVPPIAPQPMAPQGGYVPEYETEKSGSGKVWLFIILGVLLMAIIGLAVYYFMFYSKASSSVSDTWNADSTMVEAVVEEMPGDPYGGYVDATPTSSNSTLKGDYDHAFHQLQPGSGVRTLKWQGQTFNFDTDGEWINQYYEDALTDRDWEISNGKRLTEYYSKNGDRGSMNYDWDGFRVITITDYTRDFQVTRYYNSDGTLSAATTSYFNGKPDRTIYYSDYRFDSHGNWVSRKAGSTTESRTITYY